MELERREVVRTVRENYKPRVTPDRGGDTRILFLALTVDVGAHQGDSTHVIELVSNLRQMGYHVRWIARESGQRQGWADPFFYCVSRTPKPGSDLMRLFQLLLSLLRGAYHIFRHAPESDLIYSRDRFSFLLALLPARLKKKPIVYEVNGLTSEQRKMHGDHLLNRVYVWLLETLDKSAFKNATRVVCVTDTIRDFYSERFPEYAEKVSTVANGVNTSLFHPLAVDGEVTALRERLGFDEGDEIVAYVGNLSLWQGVEHLVRCAPKATEKNPAVKFMIVGHGPTYSRCRKLAEELGVGDNLRFIGQVPYSSLGHYVNLADVCVAPYTRGIPNCPIKIYEYLACGKPIVCSDIPGIDNLRDSGALILVEPNNPEALATALLDTLANAELRIAQKELGPKTISEYTWENTAKKVAAICEAAMGKAGEGPGSEQ